MKIAIIGSGVSGLASAWSLCHRNDVVLFEAGSKLGGHVSTAEVTIEGRSEAVDTGFIVYNRKNYPGFSALLDTLGAATRPTTMSFSVSCARTGLEYAGHDLNSLFAQRRNALNPRFLRMVSQILRFNSKAQHALAELGWEMTIDEYLTHAGFDGLIRTHYLLPMAAAIWSSPLQSAARMPARLLVEFFHNHGLLTLGDRPQWRTLVGGSKCYGDLLSSHFADRVRLDCPVHQVSRSGHRVNILSPAGSDQFDHVIFACHSDQALRALADPRTQEREILGALPFARNDVTLHSDTRLLPRSRRAWAAWNYSLDGGPASPARVTYNMNLLQGLDCRETLCVTLNAARHIREDRVLGQFVYDHPVYSGASQTARARRWEISGHNRTWYCGAYWGCGFHEDGFQSAMDVARRLDAANQEAA
jgi:predicted NAD/FAD-binding protein